MAVFRVERNRGYTVMSNHHLRNKELSLKAKGLLSQMLSLPEDWDYKALQENAKLLAFLQGNGINSMQELYEKVSAMNKDYYDLRGKIVKAERRLAVLDERLEMCAQYDRYKAVRQKLDKVKPRKREQYQQEHRAELADFEAAEHFLKDLKASGEAITPKAWRTEAAKLTMQKDADYQKMRAMRDEIKAVENLRKAADRLAREGQHQQKENER